jgi:UDP-N-acetylmuramyl pentapeptide phosphotransferase/UDP-N-acetylglucosamine-1-phosphate transferase
MNIVFVLLAFSISAYIARLIIPCILLISFRKKLFDMPDERKVHKRAIPRLGGVSFFPTILLSCCAVLVIRTLTGYEISTLLASYILPEFLVLICGMVLLYLTGITDDLVGVRYRQKFIVQILCASLFPAVGLWINDLYGLFGIDFISPYIGIPLTILTIVFITNAINLIDGIDGLASGLSSVALLVFGFLFMEKGLWIYSMLAFSTFGVLVPFFYYNVFGSAEHAERSLWGIQGA